MITFSRYSHIDDLLRHYAGILGESRAIVVLDSSIEDVDAAKYFSGFVWRLVDCIHEDNEKGMKVLGSTDNIEMLRDLEYEIGRLMR
jgi:hypothetical protein